MNTNILLIIIIVLLVLILFIQVLQLAAIAWLPNQFIDSFIGSSEDLLDSDQATEANANPIEIDTDYESEQKNFKGFSKSKSNKSKRWKLK